MYSTTRPMGLASGSSDARLGLLASGEAGISLISQGFVLLLSALQISVALLPQCVYGFHTRVLCPCTGGFLCVSIAPVTI